MAQTVAENDERHDATPITEHAESRLKYPLVRLKVCLRSMASMPACTTVRAVRPSCRPCG